jgi:hypothetical protein
MSGVLHGIALWYHLDLSEEPGGRSLDTGPVSGAEGGDRYWRQIVFLSEHPQQLQQGAQIGVRVAVDRLSGGVWCHPTG